MVAGLSMNLSPSLSLSLSLSLPNSIPLRIPEFLNASTSIGPHQLERGRQRHLLLRLVSTTATCLGWNH